MEAITRYMLVTVGSAWNEWREMTREADGDWVLHEDHERVVADRDAHIGTLRDIIQTQAEQLAALHRDIAYLRELADAQNYQARLGEEGRRRGLQNLGVAVTPAEPAR